MYDIIASLLEVSLKCSIVKSIMYFEFTFITANAGDLINENHLIIYANIFKHK